MVFCQIWIVRRATTYNMTKPQTFPLENPRGSNSGLRFPIVFEALIMSKHDSVCRQK